ncbi:MAG TPA: 3-isopropylmalate dehydratase large subunit [Candidatus Aquilonibacter sp.]
MLTLMPQTLFDKIWDEHRVGVRNDGRDIIYMDRNVVHDLHGSHAFEKLEHTNRSVRRPDLTFGVLDHSVATTPGRTDATNPKGLPFAQGMRAGAERFGFRLFDLDDAEQGIAHVIAPELGLVLPGSTYACPDSHACTVGGLGAVAFACGTSELEHVLATQTVAMHKPKQMRISLDGRLRAGVTAKDVILHLIGRLGVAGGRGFVVEYDGDVARDLSVEARFTLCNMTIEFGARTSIVAPDDKALAYVADRLLAPTGADRDAALVAWRDLHGDPGAAFDRELHVDCTTLAPQVTWGTDPSQVVGIDGVVPDPAAAEPERAGAIERAIAYMGLTPGTPVAGLVVDRVFIGSCTNARVEDLEAAAAVVRGHHVAARVRAIVVPGSMAVKRAAEARGLDRVFRSAGFEWHESGCSMCAGANGDLAAPGSRSVATSNRNFENRQGPGVRTHLVSPAMAAAAAIAGRIVDVTQPGVLEGQGDAAV